MKKLRIEKKQEKQHEVNKIVLCCNRKLSSDELISLNKMYSVLVFNTDYHIVKSSEELLFEMLVLDFGNKAHIAWYFRNKQHLKKTCNIISLAKKTRDLKQVDIKAFKDTYAFDSVITRIETKFAKDGDSLLQEMLIDHVGIPQDSFCSKIHRWFNKGDDKKKS